MSRDVIHALRGVSVCIGSAGIAVLFAKAGAGVLFGVFLMIWGNNLMLMAEREQEKADEYDKEENGNVE